MKKGFVILGLISTLSIGMTLGSIFAIYKNTASPNNNTPFSVPNAELENNCLDNYNYNSSTEENSTPYIYKDGKLSAYDENEANKEGSITIESDIFKEGDSVNIGIED